MTSQTRPVSIETLNSRAAALIENQARVGLPTGVFILIVGYEGSARETDWQAETLQHKLGARGSKEVSVARDANADRLWTALTEFPVCMDESLAFQASLLPSMVAQFAEQASRFGISLLSHAGNGTVIGKLAEDTRDASRAAEESFRSFRTGESLRRLSHAVAWRSALESRVARRRNAGRLAIAHAKAQAGF